MRSTLLCASFLYMLPAMLLAAECRNSGPDRNAIDALRILNNAEVEFLKTSGRPGRLEDFVQQKTLQRMAESSPHQAALIRTMVKDDDSSITLPGHTIRLIATHEGYTIVIKETQGCQRTYLTDDRGIILAAEPVSQEVSEARGPTKSAGDQK